MKKVIAIILVTFILVSMTKGDSIVIPSEALRFRVIANSNSNIDQKIKLAVKNNLENDIYTLLKDAKNVDEAKQLVNSNMNTINSSINATLKDNNINYNYQVNLGKNHFPQKEYKGVIYEEGDYDSLIVTLGKGEGNNWWCVLFPPLCLLEAEENETDEVEYQFFVKKLIDKYF